MTPRLKKIIIIGIIAVILVAALGVWINLWTVKKMEKVILGLANPNFPYTDYSQEELNKMYPQIKYADIATRVTPEQTYAKFRQALEENNLEMAIEQLSKESPKRYKENKEALTKAYEEERFAKALDYYPEKIEKELMAESIASYYYFRDEGGAKTKTHISFIKDANGDWKIDSL